MKHTGDVTLLRRVNESAVLDIIRDEGPISRSEVARRLGLSPATISRIVSKFLENQIVVEGAFTQAPHGRRPVLLEFNPRASLVIGVYVGQNMMGALSDLSGEILERRVVPSARGDEGLERLISLIRDLHTASTQYGASVRGVGVGIPSIIDGRDGRVVWAPILGWRDLPVQDYLRQALDLPVFVENEVNLSALGESWRGVGRDVSTLICLSLGGGIGAGIVLDGRLYRGAHYAAGEIGYTIPNERHLGRVYDEYGCLEEVAGSTGIVRRAEERIAAGQVSSRLAPNGRPIDDFSVDAVLAAARDGDALAQIVVEETIDFLSITVANLICTLDPQLIVISGDLSEYGDLFLEPIKERMQGILPNVPEIVLSELRMDATVLGALAMALYETEGSISVRSTTT
jgi:predicted NBD/HSP70 family sugar kinase